MSTRSRIGLTNPNGSITSVYCHNDGYPGGVGTTLFEHYQEPAKIHALVALGDLSCLDEEVAPPDGVKHSFDDRANGVTVAYTRDRGETDCGAKTDPNVTEFLARAGNTDADYIYLWTGTWAVWGHGDEAPEDAQPLELALVTDRLTA